MINKKILGYILIFCGFSPLLIMLIHEHGLIDTLVVLFIAGILTAVITIGFILVFEE